MVCQFLLYNEINQLYVFIQLLPPGPPSHHHPPPLLPLWVITEPRAGLPMLHSSFPLATYFTHGGVYMSVLTFQFVPRHPLLPHPPGPHVHSLHLYSCPGNRLICTNFQIPQTCVNINLFLSFWLTSLCMVDSRSILTSTDDPILFLLVAE